MDVRLHIPPISSRLHTYVTAIWELRGERDCNELILPQGIVEIVFNFSDCINGVLPDGKLLQRAPRCFIQGMHTNVLYSRYTGLHHLLGIRLQPHRIQALLGVQAAELVNAVIDLTLIRPGVDELWHQLAELSSFDEKLSLLQSELPDLSMPACERSKLLSDLFLSEQSEGFQTVDEMAQRVCYSPRHVNRIAHELFGLSAEELTLYKKFIASVKLIHIPEKSLTSVGYEAGFYDQSHFCRVFKSYTGMTPNQYKKQKGQVPFHIIS